MSDPPKTIIQASEEEAAAIRAAVRAADPKSLGPGRVHAEMKHVRSLAAMLADPAVSAWLYDLPQPITEASVERWVAECQARRLVGEGLLFLTLDGKGEVSGFSDILVWPDRASAELGGALRADLQNSGRGGAGMAHTFGWIFGTLGVRLMCLTAALDNVRSQKGIDRAGFRRMGERDCVRRDGTVRPSAYWEMSADEWRRRHAL